MTTATVSPPSAWSSWLTLARISNSPTVASNVLAGAALTAAVQPAPQLGLLVVAMVSFYTAGMLLNDVCDYGWDRIHRPDRPLVVGTLSRQSVLAVTVVLFALGAALLLLIGPRALAAGVVLIALIVVYDVWHKTNPLSPLVMAGCRLMVYVTSFVAFVWPPTIALAIGGLALVVYLVLVTAIAKRGAPGSIVAPLLAGISLLDAVVLAIMQAPLPWIGVAVVCFGLTLLLQRWVEGT